MKTLIPFHKSNKLALIFALVTFISALLLFAVQPIMGKYYLPFFGGSAQLWSVTVLFFQTLLFAGYVYAFLINRLKSRLQIFVHLGLVLSLFGLQLLISRTWIGPILPTTEIISQHLDSRINFLILLTLSVGPLYFVLSTTGLLLQIWYFSHTGKQPYWIYKVSNLGSLIAVFGYPFLVEPMLSVVNQARFWLVGFGVYLFGLTVLSTRLKLKTQPILKSKKAETTSWHLVFLWLSLSAAAVIVFLSFTNFLTVSITPTPFLWLLPLAMYLLSFIWAFNQTLPKVKLYSWLFVSSLVSLMLFAIINLSGFKHNLVTVAQIVMYNLLILVVTTGLHHILYRKRIGEQVLSVFYVVLSFGGMLGGVFVSLLAPVLFNDYVEVPLAIVISFGVFVYLVYRLPNIFPRSLIGFQAGLVAVASLLTIGYVNYHVDPIHSSGSTQLVSTRNLYGVVSVVDLETYRAVTHNNIIHGIEPKDLDQYPTNSYYSESAGVGRAISNLRSNRQTGLRFGVIGLGTGSMAGHCQTDDNFVFYEIDPEMIDIAYDYFRYLDNCPDSTVLAGDARLVLANQTFDQTNYDILVVDAFTGNSVPIHLLSREAVELYLNRVNPQGVVALHISNQYFDLYRPLTNAAQELDIYIVRVFDQVPTSFSTPPHKSISDWVLLTRNTQLYQSLLSGEGVSDLTQAENGLIWTDGYSSLLPLIRWGI